jgi:hypothetical protein
LRIVLNEDPEMARLYQEVYGGYKADREAEYNQIQRVHDRFDYQKTSKLDNKLPTEKYNLSEDPKELEDELFTTDLSEPELDLLYKKYKLLTNEVKTSIEDLEN